MVQARVRPSAAAVSGAPSLDLDLDLDRWINKELGSRPHVKISSLFMVAALRYVALQCHARLMCKCHTLRMACTTCTEDWIIAST